MNNDVYKLYNLLDIALRINSPVLSGNMKQHIELVSINGDEVTFCIDAPFYDLNKWKKDNIIVYTYKNINGKTAYAESVNESGGFGTHNKSEHWINRSCYAAAEVVANELGATLINELEL